jgi:hypothetical protein
VTHQGEKRPSCTHTRRQNPEVSTGATVPCHLITLTRPIGNRGLRLIATVRPFGTVAINLNPSILTSNTHGTFQITVAMLQPRRVADPVPPDAETLRSTTRTVLPPAMLLSVVAGIIGSGVVNLLQHGFVMIKNMVGCSRP